MPLILAIDVSALIIEIKRDDADDEKNGIPQINLVGGEDTARLMIAAQNAGIQVVLVGNAITDDAAESELVCHDSIFILSLLKRNGISIKRAHYYEPQKKMESHVLCLEKIVVDLISSDADARNNLLFLTHSETSFAAAMDARFETIFVNHAEDLKQGITLQINRAKAFHESFVSVSGEGSGDADQVGLDLDEDWSEPAPDSYGIIIGVGFHKPAPAPQAPVEDRRLVGNLDDGDDEDEEGLCERFMALLRGTRH